MNVTRRSISIGGSILAFVAVAAASVLIVTSFGGGQTAAQTTDTTGRTVTVSGQGTVNVEPNIAILSFGVESTGEDLSSARAAAQENADALVAALQESGVAEDDIRVSSESVVTGGAASPPEAQAPGFHVASYVTAVVRDLSNVDAVADSAVSAGATFYNASFSVDNRSEVLQQARQEALESARQNAEQLAALADASVGEIVNIRETATPVAPTEQNASPPFGMPDRPRPPEAPGETGTPESTVPSQGTASPNARGVLAQGTVPPDATGTPEATEEPESLEMPAATESVPDATGIPEDRTVPEGTIVPEGTESPESTQMPDGTAAPDATEAPDGQSRPGAPPMGGDHGMISVNLIVTFAMS